MPHVHAEVAKNLKSAVKVKEYTINLKIRKLSGKWWTLWLRGGG